MLNICSSVEGHIKGITTCLESRQVPEALAKIATLSKEITKLPAWAQFCRLRRRGEDLGMQRYVTAWQSGRIQAEKLTDAFRLVEYRHVLYKEIESNLTLRAFSRESHDSVRTKFQMLDLKLKKLNQKNIASKINDRFVPPGNGLGLKGTWSDRA